MKTPKRKLVEKLDKIYSKYVRLVEADEFGKVRCFTCDKVYDWDKIDCGHYVSRMYKNTRWTRENTQPQCRSCNRFHEGMKDVFALKLQKKYGDDILQVLNDRKNEDYKWTESDLEELITYYNNRVKELLKGVE